MGDWIETDLNQIFSMSYGKNLPTSQFTGEGYDVFGANGIIGKYKSFTHENEEVLVSCRGEYSGVIRFSNPKSYITNNSIVCSLKEHFDKKFLFYSLSAIPRHKMVSGSAQPQVVIFDLKKIKIRYPKSIPEQSTIAAILTTIDQAIDKTEQLIAKYERIKTGLMQDLLTRGIDEQGNIRSEETHEFKDSVLGRIPKEWEVEKISTYCEDIFLGLTSKVDYVEQGGFPLIRAKDISEGILSFVNILCISESQHKKITRNRKGKKGDILISKSGTLGMCAKVETDREFSIYESIIVLQPNRNKLDSDFLLWIMRDNKTQQRLLGEKVGSTVGHLNILQFRELTIAFPQKNEQEKTGLVLNEMNNSIQLEIQNLSKLQKQKNALMQDLLTGKIRVDALIK